MPGINVKGIHSTPLAIPLDITLGKMGGHYPGTA